MAKGPKTLNPADRERKEARKKELKKNKKQRQQVRSAVIESKDPEQIINDLERLDAQEFDIDRAACVVSETLFKDKRKRLKESWSRILAYYQKEDPEKHARLKKLESDYETKHKALERNFEAVKAAKEVKIEDVFLPPDSKVDFYDIADDDPLMSKTIYITPSTEGLKPPGCPPGFPPDLKQLVENIKTSVINPSSPHTLPPELLNQMSAPAYRHPSDYHRRPPRDSRGRPPRPHQPKRPEVSSSRRKSPPAKAAVIESKPVLFMPKATKFVPASVRSKVKQPQTK